MTNHLDLLPDNPKFLCLILGLLTLGQCHENYHSNSTAYPATHPQMLAVRIHDWGEPDVLKLETCDVPPPPNHDQVLILVKAAAIYPWDVKIRKNQYARPVYDLPAILGQEVSGLVIMKGKNVNHLNIGDRVFAKLVGWEGGYAQLAVANGHDTYHLPEHFSYEQGAITYHLYFGAWRGLILKCNAKPNQTLFIIGANRGNGLAAIQVGKAYGLKVFASAGCEPGMIKCSTMGADHVVDHSDPDFREQAKKLNHGENFDIILEDYAIENIKPDHAYVKHWTGQLLRHTGIEVKETSEIRGFNLFMPSERERNGTRDAVLEGIREGWYTPYVGKYFMLHQAKKAHIQILNKDQIGDFVFTGIEQHEMLYPFMSAELKRNLSNVITPTLRDLVEIQQSYTFHDPMEDDHPDQTPRSDSARRAEFLHKQVFHQLYGGTTVVTTGYTDYFQEMWKKYSTNTVDLDLTHDSYFEEYVRDYAWWTMPANRSKPTYPPPTTTDPTASTMDAYDKYFYGAFEKFRRKK
uniref:Zeta-crystallin n=1 Tax=Cacopsylla melanoneura TaxID=428564 RepID=A0A8D8Z186_9HEMI